MKDAPTLPALIERFFTERLMRQRRVSPHTIASYRDTFRLLLEFVYGKLRKLPSSLDLRDLDARMITAFLDDIEKRRSACARTRNLRLTAIRAFFRYTAFEEPAHSALIQQVLAIPSKRHDKKLIHFLTRPEIEALLAAPDTSTWVGRRDYALLSLAVQTGLRLSELTGLNRESLILGSGAHVRCFGKGRKERCTPLTEHTVATMQTWLKESSLRGARCTASGLSPHVLRHTAAMELLQAGVDSSVIALWLGHESVETTQVYLHAHLALKEAALAKLQPINSTSPARYRPGDQLLAFLNAL